ncbi:hypothetical protein K438DRAFT_1509006, partial [Mycena galopus ATCC 62051]
CAGCRSLTDSNDPKIYRCKSCYGDEMLCQTCILDAHARNPLHMIEQWNGRWFAPCSLKDLGLRVQLGHPPGERCSEPTPLHTSFAVLHTNGIHEVAVDSCDCEHREWAGRPEEQLLRAGWFPATDDRPRTCATTEVLDNFLAQTYQSKTTMYDYYSVLEKLTNNSGVKPPNRYHPFRRMVHEYAHLLMLKRAGRGHEKSGVMGTKPGELAVKCPCCPRPGENLPEGWEDAPPGEKFLYIIFLAIDACFRLKRRLVSSELKDPTLGSGWSYMVETTAYKKYLLTVTDQKEMSTCSGLAALDYANTKFSRGYSSTGVGMGVCTRHEFVQPNGVGDLQRGERYVNMDWILVCILFHIDPRLLKFISYDIVCQWWINLKARLKTLPGAMRLNLVLKLCRFIIPKMHIKGHLIDCQIIYSLNLIPGSAQTDAEGIERPWAHIGGVGSSTREMGPGSREDMLNAHWSSWNWQKLLGLGERLRTRLDRARSEHAAQMESFTQFSVQQAARVPRWRKMVEDFEANSTNTNPYQMEKRGVTEADVLLEFERKEANRVQAGVPTVHSVSPGSFIAAGLDLEHEQRRVRVQIELKKAGTTAQEIDIAALRRGLNRSIQWLRKIQATYTPIALVAFTQRQNVADDEQPKNVPLFLPSALTTAQRAMPSIRGLAAMENSMRDAQLSTALEGLRRQLHIKSRFFMYKELQARNQGANTRARALVTRNESKVRLHSEKYQMAWEARRRLAEGDVDAVGWPVLHKEDIRCMEDAEELEATAEKRKAQETRRVQREDALQRQGELPPLTDEERQARGRHAGKSARKVSWIWAGAGTTGSEAELEEGKSIEWCKVYARTRRWDEEVRLVQEEERRIGVTLECRAREWE